jgi:4'-phosphopantetheinyl transferase
VCRPAKWKFVGFAPPLGLDEIHIWRRHLAIDASDRSQLYALLSDDEKQRAARFHFERDRNRFVVARGSLRTILAQYLGKDAARLQLDYEPAGKPVLAPESTGRSLNFNVSHSEDVAIFAFGWNRNIGIDVEKVRTSLEYEEIARDQFSGREFQSWLGIPQHEKLEGFFVCWTRKEAYIKARGGGLQIPLDSFDVALKLNEPAQFLRGVDKSWKITGFLAESGYLAALVYDGTPVNVRFLSLDPASDSNVQDFSA